MEYVVLVSTNITTNSAVRHRKVNLAPTVFTTMPGTECEASPQCAGYPTGAQCLENLCVCGQGSYSNGAACVVQQPMVIQTAQDGCDQYGSPCRYVLSSVRRRPMLSVANNRTTDPRRFNTPNKQVICIFQSGLMSSKNANVLGAQTNLSLIPTTLAYQTRNV